MSEHAALERERYVSLASFRRDGREVRTPIWFAGRDGRFHAFSAGDAGKVKRIRANERVRLAPCTANGAITGAWVDACGTIASEEAEIAAAYAALRAKYGWQMWALDALARLTGRYGRRAVLTLELR